MKGNKWITKWVVQGSNDHVWKVARDRDGNFGCSCPKWIFNKSRPREDCHHITEIKRQIQNQTANAIRHLSERESRKDHPTRDLNPPSKRETGKIHKVCVQELIFGKRKIKI